MMPSSFKEEDSRSEDEVEQEIIVIRPLSSEPATYLTSLPSSCYGQAIFLPQHPLPQLLLLLPLYLHHLSKALPRISHYFSFPFILLRVLPLSLSNPPSYSDSLSSLASHTFADKPVSSLSCTLTSSLPSSLPPSYPVYRPTPIYTYSRPSNFSVGSIPYLYSSVLSTNTLSLSYHGSSSTRVSSASPGPVPSGPKKRATSS